MYNWAFTVPGSDLNANKYRTSPVTAIKITHNALRDAELMNPSKSVT